MAEAYGKQLLGDIAEIHSAGVEAHGLNPKAISIMSDDGIDITKQTSNTIDPEIVEKSDYIITLCGHANDRCPAVMGNAKRLHWDLEDPAKATGSEEEVMNQFREVREDIKSRMKTILDS